MAKTVRVVAYYEAVKDVEVPDDFDVEQELLGLPEEVVQQLNPSDAVLIDLEEAPADIL